MIKSQAEPTSWLEIDRQAYQHNLDFIKNLINPEVTFCSVVKGNAYGHGTSTIVNLAEDAGVDNFGVFSTDEAYEVKRYAKKDPEIMIMGMVDRDQMEWVIENDISFYVFNKHRLDNAVEAARKVGKPARVHLEIETGMNRTGVGVNELDYFYQALTTMPEYLTWEGLCTHYAGAESIANYLRVKRQYVFFKKLLKQINLSQKILPKMIHTACSAATMRYPATHFDMVRIGILQYGFFPSQEVQVEYMAQQDEAHTYPLRRLISWKSKVMDVKSIKTGEFIGYGTSYLANAPMRVASIPVGYCHGFARGLSNMGRVLIGGAQAKVVGMVNMNMIMADVTEVPEVNPGDEVVLIGRQGDQELSVSSFAEYSHQVNYELLTRLPRNIPRKIVSS